MRSLRAFDLLSVCFAFAICSVGSGLPAAPVGGFDPLVKGARSSAKDAPLPINGNFNRTLLPAHRLALEWVNLESDENGLFERESTARLAGEYAFARWFSLFGQVPYTRKMDSEQGVREHLDMVSLGARLGTRLGRSFYPAAALEVGLATGNEDRGIGHKRLGFLEPRIGLLWSPHRFDWFYLATMLRFNSQTNSRLRTTNPDEKFERAWIWEAEAGFYVDDAFAVFVEFQRKSLTEPEERLINTTTVAPGLRFRPAPYFDLAVSVPLSVGSEKEFERGILARLTFYPGFW
ncbi:MAG: hypothetical protein NXI24_10130 [bacterium]|nr:hypothetical protein [bacterium]